MKRRRRCCICGELFSADPRVGDRQRACGSGSCQRERHRLACRAWRERERPAVERDRLRQRLGTSKDEFRPGVVGEECGVKLQVVITELLRFVLIVLRVQWPGIEWVERRDVFSFGPASPRDETASVRGPP